MEKYLALMFTCYTIFLQKRNISPSPSRSTKSSRAPGLTKTTPGSSAKSGKNGSVEQSTKRSKREVHKPIRFLDFV